MKYQIKDTEGNIVDQNLSYEQALLWIDNSISEGYVIEKMKEGVE